MNDDPTISDLDQELRTTTAQASELWRQCEQLSDAYREVARRVDELRAELDEREVDQADRRSVAAAG